MNHRVAIAAVTAALLLGGCGDSDRGAGDDHTASTTAPPFAEADATTKLDVTLQDYAFVGIPDTVAGPNVFFTASIKGGNTHDFQILDHDGVKVAEIPAFKDSGEKHLAVVLQPGTYTVLCLVNEGKVNHAQLGMKKDFTVS